MATQARHVEAPDGRTLRVEVAGAGERVVVAHLGTPNGGVLDEPWIEDAARRGLTRVTYDRPGYGGSTRPERRAVAANGPGAETDTATATATSALRSGSATCTSGSRAMSGRARRIGACYGSSAPASRGPERTRSSSPSNA